MAWMVVRSSAVSIALALAGGVVCAQSRQSDIPTQQDSPAAAQQNVRIISLVEQLADQARASEDLTFAVRAQSQAAKLLWPLDAERARAIYRRAFQSLGSAAPTRSTGQPESANPGAAFDPGRVLSPTGKPQLRSELLNQIASCDPELADEFARDLADSIENSRMDCADCDPNGAGVSSAIFGTVVASPTEDAERCELLMSAALQVLGRQPQQAMAFAQMSVALGISSNLARLLTLMRAVDAERADLLFSNAIARLEQSSRVDIAGVRTLGSYVVSAVSSSTNQPLSKASIVRFLNFALDQIAQYQAAPSGSSRPDESTALYFVERQLIELFGRYVPDRLDQLQRYIGAQTDEGSDEEIDPGKLQIISPGDLAREGREAADVGERDSLYARASLAWLAQGELGEAQAAAVRVSADPTRDRVLVQIVRRQASEKRIEDAIDLTRRITNQTSRADLLVLLSSAARASKDSAQAVDLLDEAESCASKQGPSIERAQSLVKIAGGFAAFDTGRSFDVLQSAIKAINEIIKRPEVSKDDQSSAGTRAKLPQAVTLDDLDGASFERTLVALGKADFDRALSLAQQLIGEEAPVIAQLAVCRGGLVEHRTSERSNDGKERGIGVNH